MQHPEEGIIHAWLDGALPAEEAAALEEHVASCGDCGARVAEARGLVAAASRITGYLDAVPGNVIPAQPATARKGAYWIRKSWPAALAATLLLAITLFRSDSGAPNRAARAALDVRSVPPAPPPAVLPVPETPSVQSAADAGTSSQARQRRAAALESVALPRPAATVQKSSIVATPPSAPAPIPSTPTAAMGAVVTSEARADSAMLRSANRVVGTGAGRGGGGGGGGGRGVGGVAGGAARPTSAAPAAAREFVMAQRAESEAIRATVGCYEMNVSTDVLPARFALTADSSAFPSLLAVRYLDADGRQLAPIVDLGWTTSGGRTVIRAADGRVLLSLARTDTVVTGESPNGPRSGRVVSCR